MQAMILAAGFGTRLRPYNDHTPKPLFTLNKRPILELLIDKLHTAGCSGIVINTHHLADHIEDYLNSRSWPMPIIISHEPQILGSGGGIKKAAPHLGAEPFMVINGDIDFDFDLKQIYRFHREHPHPVTMVLHDDPEFNTVTVDPNDAVVALITGKSPPPKGYRRLTFTGIQVVDALVLESIPANGFVNIVDTYENLLAGGRTIAAYSDGCGHWQDLGTPARYRESAYRHMATAAFRIAFDSQFNSRQEAPIQRQALKGDGSDRRWSRLIRGDQRLITVDHGIRGATGCGEVDSFVAIGRHLAANDIAVPRIYLYDTFSGQVFLEDLGDTHLQDRVLAIRQSSGGEATEILLLYRRVIDALVSMWRRAGQGFDPAWAFQSSRYDETLILEKECRYFVEAFLNGYLQMGVDFDELQPEFKQLAAETEALAEIGFMHRDMQSRNIMLKAGEPFFIDFQGGRVGPLQYDLASLLIDPYVDLPEQIRTRLFDYSIERLRLQSDLDEERFREGYRCCRITRNLQILGAYSFLSQVKGKTVFEQYIDPATHSLQRNIARFSERYPRLYGLVQRLPSSKRPI